MGRHLVTGALSGVTGALSGVTGALSGVNGALSGVNGALSGVAGALSGVNGALLGLALLVAAGPQTAQAHIVREAPWNPLAAAYLFGSFAGALKPVDWQGISERYQGKGVAANTGKSAFARLAPVSRFSDIDHEAAIRYAIVSENAAMLEVAATRALSQSVRYHLGVAADQLKDGQPGAATQAASEAEGLYRAFARFIQAADPDGFKRLGLAWLDITSAIGAAPVGGSGGAPSDIARFETARQAVASYLIAQYEAPRPADARPAGPVPMAGHGADPAWRMPPWLPPDAQILDQSPLPRLVLNSEERGIDEKDLFMVAYGDMLFDSPEIFGEPARALGIACSTCHNRSEANRALYIPGLSAHHGGIDVDSAYFNAKANDMRFDPLDTPSLRGIRFTAPYGRDGRTASLREFARNVIVGEFAGPEPTPLMLDAMVAYLNEFDFLPNDKIGRDGKLTEGASDAAKRGEALFNKPFAAMGGRACATCHVPDANFVDHRRHDIGSGRPASPHAIDSAFDTPTLLGIATTAPYFHDGSLATLGDVVAWFDRSFKLGLKPDEKSDLVAYLETIGGGIEPFEAFDDKNSPFRLNFEELSTFASTLSTLIPAKDKHHALLLIRTVAPDLRMDASAIYNVRSAPKVYELADRLDAIGTAIAADDWQEAATLWAAYLEAEKRYDAELY